MKTEASVEHKFVQPQQLARMQNKITKPSKDDGLDSAQVPFNADELIKGFSQSSDKPQPQGGHHKKQNSKTKFTENFAKKQEESSA